MSGGKSLITDWSAPLALAMYPLVLLNVVPAGQRVAEFLEFLRVNKGIDQSQVHIIGHSLGAHVGMQDKKYYNVHTYLGILDKFLQFSNRP